MQYNSFEDSFTVPSKKQYSHGWLWDSGFAAMGWSNVSEKPSASIWEKVNARKQQLVEGGMCIAEAKEKVREEFSMPLFDEYFTPVPSNGKEAGMPLGSDAMTWTASFFLDLFKS